jgi:hypothetical protein
MRASTAVGLLLASSASVFGIYSTGRHVPPSNAIEPVYVNGVMGVYCPSTGEFVPSTSPMYAQCCDEIRQQRYNQYSGSSWPYYHNYYYHSFGSSYGGGYHSSVSTFDSSSFSHSSGSIRGGIGSTGHSFGGSHS